MQLGHDSLGKQSSNQKVWLIWSNEHNAWWGPAERGYVRDIRSAGLYTFERAAEICDCANIAVEPDEAPKETMLRQPRSDEDGL